MVDLQRRRLLRASSKRDIQQQPLPWQCTSESFFDGCSRCNACIDACPEKIIKQGDGGFPNIDFQRGECTFCYRCAEACPESLFSAQSEQPWQLAAQISHSCLVEQGVTCRSCEDFCELEAIRFTPRLGAPASPSVLTDACSGCGACVASCPSQSITIESNDKRLAHAV